MNETNSNLKYKVFITEKNKVTGKEYWTKIGAAFEHQDKKGISIVLSVLPLDGQLVLRIPEENKFSSIVE